MTTEVPKKPPTRRKGDSRAKELKDTNIRAQALAGKPVGEIAKDMGMDRKQVSRILNSEETKQLIKESRAKIQAMVPDALETLHMTVLAREDRANALKASERVLKNSGVITDAVELNHNFPKPTIIHKLDGSTVVLGTTADVEEDEDK